MQQSFNSELASLGCIDFGTLAWTYNRHLHPIYRACIIVITIIQLTENDEKAKSKNTIVIFFTCLQVQSDAIAHITNTT